MPKALLAAGLIGLAVLGAAPQTQAQSVSADIAALYMTRHQGDAPLVSDIATPGKGNVFSTDDFREWSSGVEGGIHVRFGALGFQLRGFTLNQSSGDRYLSPGGGVNIETSPGTGYGLGPGNTLSGTYQSETWGIEGNLTYKMSPGLSVYAGPRLLRIDENFSLVGQFGPADETEVWKAQNHMLGAHIGAQVDWMALSNPRYSGPFGLQSRIGVGLFRNSVDGLFDSSFTGVPRFPTVAASDTYTSTMVEAGIEASYQLTPNLTVSAGYKLMWLSDVTTAIGQIGATGTYNVQPPMRIAADDVLYHGFTGRLTISLP